MTHTAEERIGILEIILKEKNCMKKNQIYAVRLNGNSHWRYQRSNGQILKKESPLNPKQMAIALGKEYQKQNRKGYIRWAYITNHTH